MAKELVIPHSDLRDPSTITQRNIQEFEKHGLNIHVNEVDSLEDDFPSGRRILKVRNTKFFDMGRT